MTPLEDFQEVERPFAEVVRSVPAERWDDPTPVEGWQVRDVVAHLVDWFPVLVRDLDVPVPGGPDPRRHPAEAWPEFAAGVESLLGDPRTRDLVTTNRHFGGATLGEAVMRFFTPDVFQHTWDLAVATGRTPALDPARCAALLAGMEPMDAVLRESGQFGPQVPVDDDADPQTRLVAFIGRDPSWTPPARTAGT